MPNLNAIRNGSSVAPAAATQTNTQPVKVGFDSVPGFEALQRMAKMFSTSQMVPDQFRGDANIGNAAIALDMAIRMNMNPLSVFQSIVIIHGRPAWTAAFLIATFNQCGRFTSLDYEFQGEPGRDDWGCTAVAVEKATGKRMVGPLITIAMAKREGWMSKNGSKWQTMPELMLRYRAASWFVRTFAPEISMGIKSEDEIRDIVDATPMVQGEDGSWTEAERPATPAPTTMSALQKEPKRRGRPKGSRNHEPVQEVETIEAEPVVEQVEEKEAPKEDVTQSADPYEFRCPAGRGLAHCIEVCPDCDDVNTCPAYNERAQALGL